MKQFNSRLTSRISLTADTDLYQFEVENDSLSYIPGQFVSFVFTDPVSSARFVRSYSIAGSPVGSLPAPTMQSGGIQCRQFELIIGHVPNGKGSTLLKELPLGSTLRTTGPAGNLVMKTPEHENVPYVFCANSTGIAPFRPMLQYLADTKNFPHVQIFWGLKTVSDVYLLEEFAGYKKLWEDNKSEFGVKICLSRETALPQAPTPIPACYALGRIQGSLELLPPETYQFYICGGKDFVLDVKAKVSLQFPNSSVYVERFN